MFYYRRQNMKFKLFIIAACLLTTLAAQASDVVFCVYNHSGSTIKVCRIVSQNDCIVLPSNESGGFGGPGGISLTEKQGKKYVHINYGNVITTPQDGHDYDVTITNSISHLPDDVAIAVTDTTPNKSCLNK